MLKSVLILFVVSYTSLMYAAKTQRPNILFVIVDDQSPYDLKVYDPSSPLETPAITRLAGEGMVFDGAYHMGSWSGAVCTPSRHMVMTGRTVWHLPKRGQKTARNNAKPRPAPTNGLGAPGYDPSVSSMPGVFNHAGYITMRTCKRGNSYEGANAVFQIRNDATKRGGTRESGSYWHGQQVMDFLGEREKQTDPKPFLIYYGFSHPHDVRDGTPDLLRKYGATNHKDRDNPPVLRPEVPAPDLQVNYLPEHPFHHGHPGLRDEVKVSGVWERRDEATIRNELGREYACSENIDHQLERVLEKLEAMGELDNTYIIYTADHGMAIGRHGLQGKQNLYEHTWRVPMIVKGPGIEAGKRVQGNIYLLDVLPTLCDLAGIDIPDAVEGASFAPILRGEKQTLREVLYGVYCGGTKPGMRSVRKGDWKLIKYDVLDGEVQETQLFNLAQNPHELLQQHHAEDVIDFTGNRPRIEQVDLAEDARFSAKLKEMEALLLSEMIRLDDPYRLWNQPEKE